MRAHRVLSYHLIQYDQGSLIRWSLILGNEKSKTYLLVKALGSSHKFIRNKIYGSSMYTNGLNFDQTLNKIAKHDKYITLARNSA